MMWGLHKALVVSHATARVHHAAWRRGGNEHFATCGACLEAPEVERGNRYSALRMTAKGQSRRFGDVRASSALALKADIHHKARHVSKVP
jgi:ribosomal protein L34E